MRFLKKTGPEGAVIYVKTVTTAWVVAFFGKYYNVFI